MAVFRNSIISVLVFVLAFSFPLMCYADVVADEGSNHVQEGQTQETDQESLENEQEDYQDSNEQSCSGQQSNSPGAAGRSSGDGAAFYVSSNADNEEGLDYGNLDDSSAVRSNGFDSSDYPSEYSDPSINSYLDYSCDDLKEAIKQFYDLSESRELSDEENYQATLALFAWYYLEYGTTDDLVQAAVSSDWILSQIIGVFTFGTKDLFYGIWYMLYGVPSSWGAAATYDTYSSKGLVWYVVNLDSKATSIYSRIGQVYDRLGSANDFLQAINAKNADIKGSLSSVFERLGYANDFLQAINAKTGDNKARLTDIYERFGFANDYLAAINSKIFDANARRDSIFERIGNLISLVQAINAKSVDINASLSTLIDVNKNRLDKIISRLSDFPCSGVSLNVSGVESRLDTIIAMLGVAGAKDLLDTFLGDFNFDISSALASQISSVMQNVFPFCIPAILKQCLGLLDTPASSPAFDLDIFGASVTLDFTAQGLNELGTVTSWVCRISFLLLLLVNTKKFIFTVNRGGVADG